MNPKRRTIAPRDQAASSFSGILLSLCEGTSALGAALVDAGGETVDYAGYIEPFELKVAAAEWRLVLGLGLELPNSAFRSSLGLEVRARSKSYAVVPLPDGYALVLVLPRRSFGCSRRAVAEAVRAIEVEAALSGPPSTLDSDRWFRVEVRTAAGDRHRPEAVWRDGGWQLVTVLGRHRPLGLKGRSREVAWRARFATGMEFNLVREPPGRWFADAL